MWRRDPYYEIEARPNGSWQAYFISGGGEHKTSIGSGQVDTEYNNVLGRGEEEAREVVREHRNRRHELAELAKGTRTIRIHA